MSKRQSRDPAALGRKHRQLDRAAMGRKPVTIDPVHAALCEALRRYAAADEIEIDDPKLAKAIQKIQRMPGWQTDKQALAALATAIVDSWSRVWTDEFTP